MNNRDNLVQFMHLPGFRFSPTDEELVNHYLKRKMLGHDYQEIAEVNIYNFEPHELPEKSAMKSDIPEWYFFVPRIYKYEKSQRSKRTTELGYWKVTGQPRKVVIRKQVVAEKKTLVFYTGRTPDGIKTSWIIHEYSPTFTVPNQKEHVICKLMTDDMPTFKENGSSNVGHEKGGREGIEFYPTMSSHDNFGSTSNYVPESYCLSWVMIFLSLTRRKLILDLCLYDGFDTFPTHLCADRCSMIDRMMEDDQLGAYLNSFRSYDEMDYSLDYAMRYM